MKTKYKLNRRQAAWVAALRSGKYKQTKNVLHNERGFCCLGVACDLSLKRKWCSVSKEPGSDGVRYGGELKSLPVKVKRALGFLDNEGEFKGEAELKFQDSLAGANDVGVSFRRIATFVEKHPEAVFRKQTLIAIK